MVNGSRATGRRTVLRAAGGLVAVGASLLAGCSEAGPDDEEPASPTDERGTETSPTPSPTPEESGGETDSPTSEDDDGLDRTGEDLVEIELGDADDQSFAFDPDHVRVSVGTTVLWTNTHDVFHTVTSTDSLDEKSPNGEFDETLASDGDTFERVFDEPGTVYYYCQPHAAFMDGTIEIEE